MKKKKPLLLKITPDNISMITISVERFYNNPIIWPFLTQPIIELLEEAYLYGENEAMVPVSEYRKMIESYMNTLKN